MAQESTIDLPAHLHRNTVVGAGLSAWVHRLDAVVKSYPFNGASERDTEIAIYRRLGVEGTWHNSILQFYGVLDDVSIVLQFAHHGSIRSYLNSSSKRPEVSLSTKLRWAEQVASAIAFLHSKNIFHCDISCNNVFLDKNLNALVGDFAGSSIDGKEFFSWYETSHCPPDATIPSTQTELFALGSTLYELLSGEKPFEGLLEHQIEDALRRGQYPSLQSFPALRNPITKCWRQQYGDVDELLEDIQREASVPHSSAHRWHAAPLVCYSIAALLPLIWWVRPAKLLFKCWHGLRVVG